MYRIIFFLVLGSVLNGQPAQAIQQTEKKGSISGVVLNSQTKGPIQKAEVTLFPVSTSRNAAPLRTSGTTGQPPQNSAAPSQVKPNSSSGPQPTSGPPAGMNMPQGKNAMTDETGKFIFEDVDAGTYTLLSRRNGFLMARYGASHSGSPSATQIVVSEEQNVTNIRVEMMPQSVLSGKVLNEDGEPFQNVMVQVIDARMTRPRRQGSTYRSGGVGRTDDRGEFRVTDLSPGSYYLYVSPPMMGGMMQSAASKDHKGFVSFYYPGTPDRTQAEKIQVTPGADLSGFQIQMQRSDVTTISGKVRGINGEAVTGYFVNLMPTKPIVAMMPMAGFQPLENGGFRLHNVSPGSYNLMVQMQTGQGIRSVYQQNLEVGKDNIEDLVLQMVEPFSISGQVLLGENAAELSPSTVRVSLLPESGISFGGNSTQVEADGTFTLPNVSAGKYRIHATYPPASGYLQSIHVGEQDVTGQYIELTNGGNVKVQLDGNGGTITGTVHSEGKPVFSSVTILIVPAKKELREFPMMKLTAPDQNASFTVEQLAPGDYLVLAVDGYDSALLEDEAQFRDLERKAKKVTLKKGSSESVSLELIQTGI